MTTCPLRTSVVGSYPFPGWLEFTSGHLDRFGSDDLAELQDDDDAVAIQDQLRAGLDVITDATQKLKALKTRKKGLMQQLFPSENLEF